MSANELLQPGTELSELKFNGFLDWLVCITDPSIHWKHQPTYVLSQCSFIFGGVITLIHSFIRGGRLPWLWIGTIFYGVVIEMISYLAPDVDNFWHSQTPIILAGRRFPLHIMLLYPCFLYHASVAVAKLRLPKWSEPFAVGLGVVLIDIPYDIVSVKFVHWMWHDTDPNIYDRHYWVPWNSYYFHATFASGFTFWFHHLGGGEGKWFRKGDLGTTLLAAILGPFTGVLMFLPLYHPLHDAYKIHSEVTFFIIFTTFLLLTWLGDRSKKNVEFLLQHPIKTHWSTILLVLHLLMHYTLFWIMPILFNPENEVSTGIKEQLGPCDEYVPLQTVSGKILQKRKYLCPTDYDEKYYDWHCVRKHPSLKSLWYTICGTPFENRAEYITIISLITFLALTILFTAHFRSFGDAVFEFKEQKHTTKEQYLKSKKKK